MSSIDSSHRVERLKALLNHADFGGNKAKLGSALGYASGAYVRQLVAGERPITEKLVEKVETILGGRYRGWFSAQSGAKKAVPDAAPWPLDPFVPRERWAALSAEQRSALAWEASKALREIEEAGAPSTARAKLGETGALGRRIGNLYTLPHRRTPSIRTSKDVPLTRVEDIKRAWGLF